MSNNRPSTVQTFNSCTSRPDVYQFLIVQTPMGNIYRNTPSTSVTLTLLFHQRYVQFWGNPCIHAYKTGCQLGIRSCIMPGLPKHLVQELNVGTVFLFINYLIVKENNVCLLNFLFRPHVINWSITKTDETVKLTFGTNNLFSITTSSCSFCN